MSIFGPRRLFGPARPPVIDPALWAEVKSWFKHRDCASVIRNEPCRHEATWCSLMACPVCTNAGWVDRCGECVEGQAWCHTCRVEGLNVPLTTRTSYPLT
jgi:hypothetical protein